jgi:hypothetical protein
MPEWKSVAAAGRYWREVCTRAFWDSLLLFFDTKAGAWKGVFLFVLGMAVTTLVVWIARDREALTEHLKSNVAIVISGGLATWILVFIFYFVSEPFMRYDSLDFQLNNAKEQIRATTINEQSAELRVEETEKQFKTQKSCVIERPQVITALPQQQVCQPNDVAQHTIDSLKTQLELRQHVMTFTDPAFRSMTMIVRAFSEFRKAIGTDAPCVIKVTSSSDKLDQDTAKTVVQLARVSSLCDATGPANFDADPDAEKDAMDGSTPNMLTIHAVKGQKGIPRIFELFTMDVVRSRGSRMSYEIPKGSTENLLWLQFGKGARIQ